MRKILLISALSIVLMACGNQTKQSVGETDSLTDSLFQQQPDTLTLDSVVDESRIKLTTEYIQQRVDSIYTYIKQQLRDPNDMGEDSHYCGSLYCSEDFFSAEQLGVKLSMAIGEDGYLIGSDHWIVGQDYTEDWDYSIKEVRDITDTTAVVELNIHNFEDHRVQLDFVYERDNWFVDEFHFFYDNERDKRVTSEKAEIKRYIKNAKATLVKGKNLTGYWGWMDDDTPELLLGLEMTDEGVVVTECNVYRLHSFDHLQATFDGEWLCINNSFDSTPDSSEKWVNLRLRFDENSDLEGPYRIKHPHSNGLQRGFITLRKGYFKYRDEAKEKRQHR